MESCVGSRLKRLNRRAAIRIASAVTGNISKRSWEKEIITMAKGTVVIAGATNELGKALAKHYVEKGHRVVVSSRTMERAEALAKELGGDTVPVAFDLATPYSIAPALAGVDDVLHLV